MREIITKPFNSGEHVMINGVEYVTEAQSNSCSGCAFLRQIDFCNAINGCGEVIFKEVKKEPELMTYRQLAEWLARGNGQARFLDNGYIHSHIGYQTDFEESSVKALIRPWGSDEWIKPTVDIYERDCKHE